VLEDQPVVRLAAVFGDLLHVTVGSADRDGPVIREALTAAGLSPRSVEPIRPGMEDVFMHLGLRAEGAREERFDAHGRTP
jgi:hypothetical protein